jgi:aminoglycoside 3-N-acetyltransferase
MTPRFALRVPVQTIAKSASRTAIKRVRTGVKSFGRELRARYAGAFHSFGPDELGAALRQLGIAEGDALLVHSSFDAFEAFTGRVTDVVTSLQKAVGESGILLMPTMPFAGTAVDWAREHPVVDLRRTPSRMGLISEIFRRSPGVVRSVHPTHPAAAWGREAAAFVSGHQNCATPCGIGSPYHRLLERDGKILFLGADLDSLTFFHTAEALLEARLPVSPFTTEEFRLECIAPDGTRHETRTRLFEPSISRHRNLFRLKPELERRRALQRGKVGLLAITTVSARAVVEATAALIERGIYCYDNYPAAPAV